MGWLISDLFPSQLVERLRSGEEQFVVTGATGWFGSLLVGLLDEVCGAETPDRLHVYASRDREIRTRAGRVLAAHSIESLPELGTRPGPLHFLHFAFAVPARTAAGDGTGGPTAPSRLTELVAAAVEALQPRGLCYPSSGAVHGGSRSPSVSEYGRRKAADEATFRGLAAAVGAGVVVPRVFAVGGPCSPEPQRYLLGELVHNVLAGTPLHLRSTVPVYRSYVSLADVLGLVLTKLLRDERTDVVFDACGDEVVEAAELAQRVRDVLGRPEIPIIHDEPAAGAELRQTGPVREDRYVGDPAALHSLADECDYPLAPLDEVIRQAALA